MQDNLLFGSRVSFRSSCSRNGEQTNVTKIVREIREPHEEEAFCFG
jgi:hypothetical protein